MNNSPELRDFLANIGISNATFHYNLGPEALATAAVKKGQAKKTSLGAITIDTGEFTGRSPKDRFIVRDEYTEKDVWWGNINIPFESSKFDALYQKVVAYLSNKELYVRDGYACADQRYRLNIRTINEYPWSNLFVYNMFLRPTSEELNTIKPDWIIINAPGFMANHEIDGTRQHNFAILNFTRKIALVGGTGYTGEMKKGIFSALNFILPLKHDVLAMHCSANTGHNGSETAIFFGLSGTGKTTLSADPNRKLIGDDEHGWSPENTVFNFEGGCYAKTINLSEEDEPDIYRAIKPGALLENIRFFPGTNDVNFADSSVTLNTRVSYPLYHIDNIAEPSVGKNPKNIFFLTCDAYGVLPPIARLTPGQAAFHFISGYTAKVAGTEAGIDEPVRVFSACFGAPFMLLHPTRYGEMLSDKVQKTGARVWLVNTGWSGGAYGTGKRMSLKITRALITAALNGDLDEVSYHEQAIFQLAMPEKCPGVPDKVLNPRSAWEDEKAYEATKIKLAAAFLENFKQFSSYANKEILEGAPKLPG
ncbi:MAG: phosphoenolpyruvate carboxykinase (ATP) [Cyclobacteriaceae bacterium]|nr:phosphoenolpyruvate carboxykinase (ATP) [Cyclobacteriaceae bacterium]